MTPRKSHQSKTPKRSHISWTPQKRIAEFIATGFYAGKIRFAPGTWGTLVGLLLFLPVAGHVVAFWILFTLILVVSVPVSSVMERVLGRKDPPSVVIDEIAGYFVTMAALPLVVLPSSRTFALCLAGFAFFRLFDIWKPFPINKLQNLPSGWGIVIDDLLAGVYANIGLRVIIHFWH